MSFKVLAINPGSTSTKVALYEDERPLFELTLRHSAEEIAKFANVAEQLPWRREIVLKALEEQHFDIRELSAVIGRGGLIRPVTAGVYEVNSRMRYDLRNAQMKHACNLGGLLAAQIAHMAKVKAYIADPPVVDEMDDVARITGMPMCPRKPIFHALNQKAIARMHCQREGRVYEETNLIVAHMGGGISVAAHKQGRIVDVNNALDGDGPFAPDRAGNIPSAELIKVCFSGKYTKDELLKFISSKGGLVALLGTNSVIQVMERIGQGDERAAKVLDATERIVQKDHLTTLMITHNMKDAIVHGNRLIMMYEGNIALDISGEEKKKLTVEDLLAKFGQATGSDEADDKLLLG